STTSQQVNIGASVHVTAGVNNKTVVQIKPMKVNNIQQLDPLRLGTQLTMDEKTALGLAQDIEYEYRVLDANSINFAVTTGTIVEVIAGFNGGGTAGAFYRYIRETQGASDSIVLDQENFADTSKWQPITPTYDLNTPGVGSTAATLTPAQSPD